jgi:hypothetical protein
VATVQFCLAVLPLAVVRFPKVRQTVF